MIIYCWQLIPVGSIRSSCAGKVAQVWLSINKIVQVVNVQVAQVWLTINQVCRVQRPGLQAGNLRPYRDNWILIAMLRQFKSLSNDISSSWKNIEYTCKMINTYLLVLMLNQPKMKILMDQKHKLNYMIWQWRWEKQRNKCVQNLDSKWQSQFFSQPLVTQAKKQVGWQFLFCTNLCKPLWKVSCNTDSSMCSQILLSVDQNGDGQLKQEIITRWWLFNGQPNCD